MSEIDQRVSGLNYHLLNKQLKLFIMTFVFILTDTYQLAQYV